MTETFISRRFIEGSTQWLNEKRDWEAKQHGLCVHCHGTGKQRAKDVFVFPGNLEMKPCRYCRATGRNLDLEARSVEVHEERISKLTFSQCIREYCQLRKKEYSIDGFQPFTTDERRWFDALAWRLRRDFQIGSCGKTYNGIWLRYYEDVMLKWERRLWKRDQKLYKYVWEK